MSAESEWERIRKVFALAQDESNPHVSERAWDKLVELVQKWNRDHLPRATENRWYRLGRWVRFQWEWLRWG